MDLDVGSGGGVYAWKPRAEICISYDLPKSKTGEQIIRGDAHHLPFRNSQFDTVFAFNILEHVSDPKKAIMELVRVGSTVRIRQDGIFNLANYATPEHFWFQLPGLRFIKYPRTRIGIFLSQRLRKFLSNKTRMFRLLLPPNHQYETVLKGEGPF